METVSECNIIVEVQNNTYDFTSPGWPYGYDSFLSCNWVFFSPSGTHLKLRFLTMDLEETSECTDDFVAVYSGNALTDESNAKLLQKLCLANSTSVDIDVDNVMTVKFETDGYRNNSGFSAFVSKGVKLFFLFSFSFEIWDHSLTLLRRVWWQDGRSKRSDRGEWHYLAEKMVAETIALQSELWMGRQSETWTDDRSKDRLDVDTKGTQLDVY